MQTQRTFIRSCAIALLVLLLQSSAFAADWTPQSYTKEETLAMRTTGPEEGAYWFPVWLVVLNNQVYVRLGSRAASRIQKNTTAPYIGVKIAGQEFDRIKVEEAPDMVEAVAKAIADKYWSDLFIRWFPHPLTLRLIPESR